LFFKLKKYVTADPKTVKNHVSWKQFQEKLEKLHLESCSSELLKLFDKTIPSEDNVKTFHICNNQKNNGVTEPTHKNTTQMIYTFLTAIYQRNVLASLVKFIILKPLLHQLEISALMPQKNSFLSCSWFRKKSENNKNRKTIKQAESLKQRTRVVLW